MPKPGLVIGEHYGDMICIEKVASRSNHARFRVKCAICGREKEVYGTKLKNGEGTSHKTSCKPDLLEIGKVYGDLLCIAREEDRKHMQRYLMGCTVCHRTKSVYVEQVQRNIGLSHKQCAYLLKNVDRRFHECWQNMRNRTNPAVNNPKNKCYIEKGIESDAFKYFIDFYDAMYTSYVEHVKLYGEKNTTLDRIDSTKDYTPENCRWATLKEQAQNRVRRSN